MVIIKSTSIVQNAPLKPVVGGTIYICNCLNNNFVFLETRRWTMNQNHHISAFGKSSIIFIQHLSLFLRIMW